MQSDEYFSIIRQVEAEQHSVLRGSIQKQPRTFTNNDHEHACGAKSQFCECGEIELRKCSFLFEKNCVTHFCQHWRQLRTYFALGIWFAFWCNRVNQTSAFSNTLLLFIFRFIGRRFRFAFIASVDAVFCSWVIGVKSQRGFKSFFCGYFIFLSK